MLDIKLVREQPDVVRDELRKRGYSLDFERFIAIDEERRKCITDLEAQRAQQNEASDRIAKLQGDERMSAIESVRLLKESIAKLEDRRDVLDTDFFHLALQLPNITHESVPVGPDESGNVVIKTVGQRREFDFEPLPHQLIPAVIPCLDFERGAKVSGSRFWYIKGKLAILNLALMNYALRFYSDKGFEPMLPPVLVKEEAMWGTGFFPADKNEIYTVNESEDKLFLVGTAEVPLAAYHMDEVVDVSKGPIKYVGFSPCFRREAGTYGKDMKGMIRGHQFQKIEMFIYAKPQESWQLHEHLLKCAEEFLQSLGLQYQVLNMCTGDIGAPNAKKYDIETWMPGQQAFRETNSCSNDTDFQARRLKCVFVNEQGNREFVHTLNNTGCADLRTLVAILENYQEADGSITIPEVLRPWCGFDRIEAPKQ